MFQNDPIAFDDKIVTFYMSLGVVKASSKRIWLTSGDKIVTVDLHSKITKSLFIDKLSYISHEFRTCESL